MKNENVGEGDGSDESCVIGEERVREMMKKSITRVLFPPVFKWAHYFLRTHHPGNKRLEEEDDGEIWSNISDKFLLQFLQKPETKSPFSLNFSAINDIVGRLRHRRSKLFKGDHLVQGKAPSSSLSALAFLFLLSI